MLEEEGIIGVGMTFGQIIGKNGREKNNLVSSSVVDIVRVLQRFPRVGVTAGGAKIIIKGEMSSSFGICCVLLCHFVAKKQIQIVDVVVGVSAVVVGYIYHFLVGGGFILSIACDAGVGCEDEDQLEHIRALAICKKIQLGSNAADESYMGVINTGAACCERAWWW